MYFFPSIDLIIFTDRQILLINVSWEIREERFLLGFLPGLYGSPSLERFSDKQRKAYI